MADCQGCGVALTPANDSDAHMIPRALGGRLAPRGILCRICNSEFNGIADKILIEAFGAWPLLLDIPVQGTIGSKTVDTKDGHRVRMADDGTLTRMDVVYDVQELPEIEGHRVTFGAGDMKTARQLLARAKKDFPQLELVEAQKHLKVQGLPSGDELKLSLDFGPATFGGVLTAIWLFLIYKTGQAFVDKARLMAWSKNLQEQRSDTFRYYVDGLLALEGPDIKLGHKIVVRSVPSTGHLVAFVEVMSTLKIGGVIAHLRPGQAMEHIYAYDLLENKDRSAEFSINPNKFDTQDWKSTGLTVKDGDALRTHFREALQRLADIYYARAPSEGADDV